MQHLAVGEELGLQGVVLHVGSSKRSTEEEAVARLAAGLAEAWRAVPGAGAVFRGITGGAGGTRRRAFAQLRAGADAVDHAERLGFCLDTEHLFALG